MGGNLMKHFLIVIVMMMAVVSCKTMPPIVIEPDGSEFCPSACHQLKTLGCPEGEDLPDGPSCVEFCTNTQKSGHSMNPGCLMTIETCNEVHTKCHQ